MEVLASLEFRSSKACARDTHQERGNTDKTTHKIKSLGAIGYRTLVKVQILNPKLLLSPKHAR